MKKINKTLLLASTFLVSGAFISGNHAHADGGYDLNVEPSTTNTYDGNKVDELATEEIVNYESSSIEEIPQDSTITTDYTTNIYKEIIPQDLTTEDTIDTIETEQATKELTAEAEVIETTTDEAHEQRAEEVKESTAVAPAEVATEEEPQKEILTKENFDDIVYYDDKSLDEIFNPEKEATEASSEEKAEVKSSNEEVSEETLEQDNRFAPKGTGVLVNEGNALKYYENNKLVKNASVIVNDKFYTIDSKGHASNPKSVWGKIDKNLYYVDETGSILTGIRDIKGDKYYFNNNGVLQRNKKIVTGDSYYEIADNGKMLAPRNRWATINNRKYYNDNNGKLLKGINTIGAKTYFFNEAGVLSANKKLVTEDRYYVVDKYGVATNPKNAWFNISGNTYKSDANGKILKGAHTIDGNQYVFDTDGVMAQNKTILSAGRFYETDAKGIAKNPKNQWVTHNGQKYHTNESGYVKEGVWRIDDQYYYFTSNGLTPNQVVTQKGVLYTVDEFGIATKQDNIIEGEKNLDKVMEWMFMARDTGMTYNMGAGRNSSSQADCSSAVYRSLIYGGFLQPGSYIGNTETLMQMGSRGTVMYEISEYELQHGDIFVAGTPGASLGANGHTGFILNPYEDTIIHMNYGSNGVSVTPRKGNMGDAKGLPIRYYRLVGANSTGMYLFQK